jgi:hypothetical protein
MRGADLLERLMRFSLIAAASLTCACVYIPSDPMLDDVRTDSGVVISRDIGGCGVPGAFDDGTVRYLRITIRDANGRRQNPVFKYGKSFLSAAQVSDVFTTIMLFDHEFRMHAHEQTAPAVSMFEIGWLTTLPG